MRLFWLSLIFFFLSVATATGQFAGTTGWKAGVSRVAITPEEPVWLAGYAARTHPSEGTLTDLWAKALALEDAKGTRVVLITTDLLGFPKPVSDRIRDQIGSRYGLNREQIILCSSHTHTGPVLTDALTDVYPIDNYQAAIIKRYTEIIENKIVNLAGTALYSMVPATVYSGNGITRFQVNRRNNPEKELTPQTELKGPDDYAVPVLKVTDAGGKLLAIVFGYACHATTLKFYQVSGDYPGFAQLELERQYPGSTALFFQGAGADQNPLPRGTVQLARQYGKELAAAVGQTLDSSMKRLEPSIAAGYSEFALRFAVPPSEKTLNKMIRDTTGYIHRWAFRQLEILKNQGKRPDSYPAYPVQIWKLGDQPLLVMGGEVVVEYAIGLKKLFGPDIFVIGYANDVMGYIPSKTVLREGGYEGDRSHIVYGLPAKWSPEVPGKIMNEIKRLAEKTGVNQVR